MIAALDAAYAGAAGCGACVLFNDWTDASPAHVATARVGQVEAYAPGAFYLRELPVLRAALEAAGGKPHILIVDGYVWLDARAPGLGARLREAWGGAAVIGVAKTRYRDDDWSIPVSRGKTKRPLFVTAVGMDQTIAAERIAVMAGAHRIPTLLGLADRLAREGVNA